MKLLGRIETAAKSERARSLLDQPRLFNIVRDLLAGGQVEVHQYIQQALALSPQDHVIDMCCGTGDYAVLVPGKYTGVDLNEKFIEYAKRRYPDDARKQFIVEDATRLKMPDQAFTHAFFISGLHHFPEDLNLGILKEMNRITSGKIAIVDLIPDQSNPIRYLLTRLDRGDYVRPVEKQRGIIEQVLHIQEEKMILSRLAALSIYICTPRIAEVEERVDG
jgi:ubiquinone/menaquinone biosynthesis C-methylase UbiE